MMVLTIKDVETRWCISRAKIYRDIQKGKLSRLPDGSLELSEVLRVYGDVDSTKQSTSRSRKTTRLVELPVDLDKEKQMLQEKVNLLLSQLKQAEEDKVFLKEQLVATQRLLTYKSAEPVQHSIKPKKGLFGRLVDAITE